MHKSSKEMMKLLLKDNLDTKPGRVLDVGSYDVNGNYKNIIPPGYEYIGCDIANGPNVDVVMPTSFFIPFIDNCFDVVISGQCLEHCKNPFKLVREMARVLKPKGWLFVTAPFVWREHKHPIDTFRYLPDGFEAIFDECGLRTIDVFLNEANNGFGGVDCWGIATKD